MSERRGIVTEDGMLELGQRIEQFRKQNGILQAAMAERLGVTQPMISRMERGEVRIHAELIVLLAEIFSVSADELLGVKTRTEPPATKIPRRWLTRLTKIQTLPRRDQDGLIQTVDRYLKASGCR